LFTYNFPGPIAGYIFTRVQHRTVAFFGTIAVAVGYVILAYASSIYLMIVATSIIGTINI